MWRGRQTIGPGGYCRSCLFALVRTGALRWFLHARHLTAPALDQMTFMAVEETCFDRLSAEERARIDNRWSRQPLTPRIVQP